MSLEQNTKDIEFVKQRIVAADERIVVVGQYIDDLIPKGAASVDNKDHNLFVHYVEEKRTLYEEKRTLSEEKRTLFETQRLLIAERHSQASTPEDEEAEEEAKIFFWFRIALFFSFLALSIIAMATNTNITKAKIFSGSAKLCWKVFVSSVAYNIFHETIKEIHLNQK